MKTALIKNGVVENIIESSEKHNVLLASKYDAVIDITSLKADIGWAYDGSKIIVPPVVVPEKTPEEIARITERNEVKAIDVDSMVDNLTKSDLKKVLKWLIKRTG